MKCITNEVLKYVHRCADTITMNLIQFSIETGFAFFTTNL